MISTGRARAALRPPRVRHCGLWSCSNRRPRSGGSCRLGASVPAPPDARRMPRRPRAARLVAERPSARLWHHKKGHRRLRARGNDAAPALAQITAALEAAGIEFLNSKRPGVRIAFDLGRPVAGDRLGVSQYARCPSGPERMKREKRRETFRVSQRTPTGYDRVRVPQLWGRRAVTCSFDSDQVTGAGKQEWSILCGAPKQ